MIRLAIRAPAGWRARARRAARAGAGGVRAGRWRRLGRVRALRRARRVARVPARPAEVAGVRVSVSGTEVADGWASAGASFRPVLVGERACATALGGAACGCARSRDRPARKRSARAPTRPLGSVSSRCCTWHRAARSPTSAAAPECSRSRRPRSASPCSRSATTWRPSRPRSPTRAATTSSWPGSSGSTCAATCRPWRRP